MRRPRGDKDKLVEELRDRARTVERRLDESEASRRRADGIIVQLCQDNAALNERMRELEAPSSVQHAPLASASVPRGRVAWVVGLVLPPVTTAVISGIVAAVSYINLEGINIVTLLSSAVALFGIVGALVGGFYYGSKTAVQAASQTTEAAKQATEAAKQAARQAAAEAAVTAMQDAQRGGKREGS